MALLMDSNSYGFKAAKSLYFHFKSFLCSQISCHLRGLGEVYKFFLNFFFNFKSLFRLMETNFQHFGNLGYTKHTITRWLRIKIRLQECTSWNTTRKHSWSSIFSCRPHNFSKFSLPVFACLIPHSIVLEL